MFKSKVSMSETVLKSISIFMTIDLKTIHEYFNVHDPAPIYKRQLSHQLEEYINESVISAKRYSVIFYKLKCTNEIDKQYAEPLMYAIRRHFQAKKLVSIMEFEKFKRRSWMLLAMSLTVVILSQGFLPLLLNHNDRIQAGIGNTLDIFSYVILWRPIERLLFYWNPHLKDISLLNKLATAESIIINNEK